MYALYWMMVRQHGILPHIDAALELSNRSLVQGVELDSLQRVLGYNDIPLLKGLALSQLGVIVASVLGHRAIVKIDQSQKCSTGGWLFALGFLLILVLMAWVADIDLQVRIPAFIEQVKDAAQQSGPSR